MKITKIKTKIGEFGTPVSTEISAVVEQIRSEKTKAAATRIASIALRSRLMMQQGAPRYYLNDKDRLPYLIFSATFGKSGLDHPIKFTSLVLLDIPCPQGQRQVDEMRNVYVRYPSRCSPLRVSAE